MNASNHSPNRKTVAFEPARLADSQTQSPEHLEHSLLQRADKQNLHTADDPYGLDLKTDQSVKILTINAGSSSLKYCVFDTADEARTSRGQVERIGLEGTRLSHRDARGTFERVLPMAGFSGALQAMVETLAEGVGDVQLVAHRVVHGGEKFTKATLVDDSVLAELEKLNQLAPLHNPVNLAGIRELQRLLPAVGQVAVFDTAFHHTLPARAYLYGLPYEYYEMKAVRRYGFHGTSHHYVSLRAAQFLRRDFGSLKSISCHLGNGSSVCAVDGSHSVDTSMGFTPSEGLLMGTRCGDIDSGVLTFLARTEGLFGDGCEALLSKQSGLLGLSGLSSDMRELQQAAAAGNRRAALAIQTYCYRLRKYIGAYIAVLGGIDALIFTGGIGQGSAAVRESAVAGLDCMGLEIDAARNADARGFIETCRISTDNSKVAILVIPTDEERMMAREALHVLDQPGCGQPRSSC